MSEVSILFPHQLFKENPLVQPNRVVYLVEEYLFFCQYSFHKAKLAFHRASMKSYADYLRQNKVALHYIEAHDQRSDIRKLLGQLKKLGVSKVYFIDPVDDWLSQRIRQSLNDLDISFQQLPSPLFLNSIDQLEPFFRSEKKKYSQTKFYIDQRKSRDILLDNAGHPLGGKWSFDKQNRKKYPRDKIPPKIETPGSCQFWEESITYVEEHFQGNPGFADKFYYPIDFHEAEKWLDHFLEDRFSEFGTYEDAIVKEEVVLHHAVLTPMLNTGLLTPQRVLDRALEHFSMGNIPLNSIEGLVRQIIGWREFVRGIYQFAGKAERTRNFWGFNRKLPTSFYHGTTGVLPFDCTVKKVLQTGYCHHIERLMILGNFMLLCEIDPDEVYRWFMELFIDAYDWVMVPNVYGMSQFADGGLFATKPYISGSNYILKMSDYPKGEWQEIWDALFWRFMNVHRDFFLSNPRLGMLINTFDRMDEKRQRKHMNMAESFLTIL